MTNDQYKDLHKSLREFSGQGGLGAYIHYYYNNYEKYGINFRDEDPKKPSAEEANRAVYEKLQKYMHNANVNANTEAAKKLSEHYTNLLYPTPISKGGTVEDNTVSETIYQLATQAFNEIKNTSYTTENFKSAFTKAAIADQIKQLHVKEKQQSINIEKVKTIVDILKDNANTIQNVNIKDLQKFKLAEKMIQDYINQNPNIKTVSNKGILSSLKYIVNELENNFQNNISAKLAGEMAEYIAARATLGIQTGLSNIQASIVGQEKQKTYVPINHNLVDINMALEGITDQMREQLGVKRARGFNTGYKDGKFVKGDTVWGYDAKLSRFYTLKESAGTVDVSIDLQSKNLELSKLLGLDKINLSMKNYTSTQIKLIKGTPLLSVMQLGTDDFSNHYLSLMSSMQNLTSHTNFSPSSKSFAPIQEYNLRIKEMIAIRSLTGERGQGQTFRQNDFIVLNDKKNRKVNVYSVQDILNKILIYQEDLLTIKGMPEKRFRNRWRGPDYPDLGGIKQRIAEVIANANKYKLTATLNEKKLKPQKT